MALLRKKFQPPKFFPIGLTAPGELTLAFVPNFLVYFFLRYEIAELRRPIAAIFCTVIKSVCSFIIERIVLGNIITFDSMDKYQFGFKQGHSTTMCTGVVKKTIDYYINRGSHVFVCLVDFRKAFDCVNYWKLFTQLVEEGINVKLVKLLAYWFANQEMSVLWNNVRSNAFTAGNGTKQGGAISPYLFTRYIRVLLSAVASSRYGLSLIHI